MNVLVSKKDLLHLATRAAGVAEKKSTMPTLSMVHIEASTDRLTLSATDLYQSIVDSCPAETTKPGAIAVGAGDLVARIKTMPDGPVSLSTNDHTLVIKSVGTARKFNLRGMDAGDFPPLPKIDPNAARLTLDAPVLSSLIAHTIFSVATDETRPHLNGTLVEWDGDVIRAVSTDGHRLSKAERKVAGQTSLTMLIPLKAIKAIQDLASGMVGAEDAPAAIAIVQAGASAFFLAGSATFSVKLVDAQFPPWKQVIPETAARSLRAPRTALADAIRSVCVAAGATFGVKLSLSTGTMRLASESAETGAGNDEIPVEYSGENMSIGLNGRYLLDVLGALSSDEVIIELNNELDPMVVKPTQSTGTDFVGVLMPMRI